MTTDDATPPTLLLVDDEELNRDMLGRRLERHGYRVVLAEDGHAALSALDTAPVDLVLLDVMMPGLNGLDVLRRIRQRHGPDRLPGYGHRHSARAPDATRLEGASGTDQRPW